MNMPRMLSLSFSLIVLVVIDTRAWTFSNLLMTGSQATLTYADTVMIGCQRGLTECQEQFQWEKWNCPQSIFTRLFSRNKLPANREVAFVHSIISAGIVHTVTRNCSQGQFENCRCDSRRRGKRSSTAETPASTRNGFRWGGCSDNVEFGFNLAKTFLDDRETGHDSKAIINLHNNEVGRMAVRNTMTKICKCHGISGSCTTQTCWMRISDFKTIGNYLKNSYRRAIKIESNMNREDNSPGAGGGRANMILKSVASVSISASSSPSSPSSTNSFGPPPPFVPPPNLPENALAFAEESPDYCSLNSTLGSNGTLGRLCSKRKGKEVPGDERRSCRKLCRHCGYRVKKQRKRVLTSCNCKFKWCCEVQCDSCAREELTYTCTAIG